MPLQFDPIFEAANLPFRQFRTRIGATTRAIKKAKMEGIDVATADRWSVKIDRHPVEIYGMQIWCDAILEEANDRP